jgi:hypothetical protein
MPVNSVHPDFKKFLPKWERCRDVSDGQDAVHEAGERYLPKLKDQQAADYKNYVKRATFYNATWRTIAGLTGMLFRKPPKIEVPDAITELLKDVDSAGQPFQLFLQDVSENALKYGRVGVLVDYPTAPEGITQADAVTLNLRPTMQIYNTFAIINWQTGRVANQTVLVQVVLKEQKWVAKDEYTGAFEDRWRVLDLVDAKADASGAAGKRYRQRVYKMAQGQAVAKNATVTFVQEGSDIFPKMGNVPLDHIPFVIIGSDTTNADVDEPPLIDLVDMNLSHYRTSADYAHGCHFTGLPTLFLSGFRKENPGDKIYIGSESAIVSSSPDAKASYVEFTGKGLESLEKKLDREEQQMAILGARMLEPQRRGVEAPETAAIHRKGEESMLSSVAQALSLAMTIQVKRFTDWAGVDSSKVLIDINRDFYPAPMTPQMLTALLAGWQQGAPGLSDQGLFDQLKAGEIVPEDADLEDEQARIAEQQQKISDMNAASQAAAQVDANLTNKGGNPQGGGAADGTTGP